MILTPAYGRDYTNLQSLKKDLLDNKDFRGIEGLKEAYTSMSELVSMGINEVQVRYDKLRKVTVINLKNLQDKQSKNEDFLPDDVDELKRLEQTVRKTLEDMNSDLVKLRSAMQLKRDALASIERKRLKIERESVQVRIIHKSKKAQAEEDKYQMVMSMLNED